VEFRGSRTQQRKTFGCTCTDSVLVEEEKRTFCSVFFLGSKISWFLSSSVEKKERGKREGKKTKNKQKIRLET
jgi:hypothetical protein